LRVDAAVVGTLGEIRRTVGNWLRAPVSLARESTLRTRCLTSRSFALGVRVALAVIVTSVVVALVAVPAAAAPGRTSARDPAARGLDIFVYAAPRAAAGGRLERTRELTVTRLDARAIDLRVSDSGVVPGVSCRPGCSCASWRPDARWPTCRSTSSCARAASRVSRAG
jgi:hypothetical protein